MKTTLAVEHANCPDCFNETLEDLRRIEGVHAVRGSMAGPCIEVDHEDNAVDLITAAVRDRLHGVEMFSNEVRMVPIEPVAEHVACDLHATATATSPRRAEVRR